ncbi:class I SAM-dependent methyltransferase [Saccharopolyspora spinosa]|uniref:Methyltransferase family protein n=1 Tax=Saccharopolyspora spinosa TaxID=60894 RepID=A0A2N3Y683_SACSN|nr:class I SAM-dependent methyltransferase [Saccharopolyspora spinosa]PKW18434.1 methyltransferase family protein [Saccharopolyspora spinosa]
MAAESEAHARGFAIRMFTAAVAAQELFTSYLGLKLGFYRELAAGGPATPPELARQCGADVRYVREWLEQQAVAGILEVHDQAMPELDRRYLLPAGHAEALLGTDSPYSISPIAVLPMGATGRVLPALLDAYRTGGGVPYTEYGEDSRDGHAGSNRALFTNNLADWIRRFLPDIHNRLLISGRVADVGCGAGWASIALAKAYPDVHVDGFDLDQQSVLDARRNAAEHGVADRVSFEVRDCGDAELAGSYQLVCIFDALHDMSRPVEVLRTCRVLRANAGTVLVMDAKVPDQFTAPGGDVERFLHAASVLHCLPVGRSEEPSAATGTAMRPSTVRTYAVKAGFSDIAVLPVDDLYHRLYRLLD